MKKSIVREIITDLLIVAAAIAVFFTISKVGCNFVIISGSSMNDTLKDGDAALTFYYDVNNIERFDIAVIQTEGKKRLIKRVIGLPSEEIEYKDNKLYINGEYIEENFLDDSTFTNDFKVDLNEDEYYCLGDNREISNDSRSYGPFSKNSILNSHIFIIYPFNRIGFHK